MPSFEDKMKKYKGRSFSDPKFKAEIQQEIEDHLLEQSGSMRAVAEVIATIMMHLVLK